uniref:Uncharacterized protein n=1 Tax=Streptomyces olivaceus TaxID=47716 RepID=A0A2R3ZQ51_STROV|nr:hypothetical protein [Streptomyces olivaceus]
MMPEAAEEHDRGRPGVLLDTPFRNPRFKGSRTSCSALK